MKSNSVLIYIVFIGLSIIFSACVEDPSETEDSIPDETAEVADEETSDYLSYHPSSGVVQSCLDSPCEQKEIGICAISAVADHIFLARIRPDEVIEWSQYNEDCSGPYQWPYIEMQVELTRNLLPENPIGSKVRLLQLMYGDMTHGPALYPGAEYLFSVLESEGEYFVMQTLAVTRVDPKVVEEIETTQRGGKRTGMPSHIPKLMEQIQEARSEDSVCQQVRDMLLDEPAFIHFDENVRIPANCNPGRRVASPSEDVARDRE